MFGVFVMTWLIGCVGFAPKQLKVVKPSTTDQSHALGVGGFENWRLMGRIAVKRGGKGFSAGLRWRQAGPDYEMWVTAPLNKGTYRLQGGTNLAELRLPTGEIFRADKPETLMLQHLGWSIPLSGTRYWIRGIPDPAVRFTQENLDKFGRWSDFQQNLWTINILTYVALEELYLPSDLSLSRDDLEVRIAIKQWERR
jgi:outer membrane lipoprotein LolB